MWTRKKGVGTEARPRSTDRDTTQKKRHAESGGTKVLLRVVLLCSSANSNVRGAAIGHGAAIGTLPIYTKINITPPPT